MPVSKSFGFGFHSATFMSWKLVAGIGVPQKDSGLGVEILDNGRGITVKHLRLGYPRQSNNTQMTYLFMLRRGPLPAVIPASWQVHTPDTAGLGLNPADGQFAPDPNLLYYRYVPFSANIPSTPTYAPSVMVDFPKGYGPTVEPGQTLSALFLPTYSNTQVFNADIFVFAQLNILGTMEFQAGRPGRDPSFRSLSKGAIR